MKHTAPHLLSLLVFAKALAAQAPPDAAQVDRATAALDAALR